MQDKKHMYLTVSKADFFQLQFFQATARLEEKSIFKFIFFQQIANCFETVEKTTI